MKANFSNVKWSFLILPAVILLALVIFLWTKDALSKEGYIDIQKNCFLFINGKLSQFPDIEYNMTQLGNALIVMSLLSMLVVILPKMWEAMIWGSLFSAIFTNGLKNIFKIPRPAAVLDHNSFKIIGETLAGNNSLPSGHSITIFTMVTILMLGFSPSKFWQKILWFAGWVALGAGLALSRVALGAHYPLDVIVGGVFGYVSGVCGILLTEKLRWWNWLSDRKYSPFLFILFLAAGVVIVQKMFQENLPVYYIAIAGLAVSLFIISKKYVQK